MSDYYKLGALGTTVLVHGGTRELHISLEQPGRGTGKELHLFA